jgi:hypothetical protein
MNEQDFYRLSNIRPTLYQHILYWSFRLLYLGACVAFALLVISLADNLHQSISDGGNVIVSIVPSYANGILWICSFFIGLLLLYYPLSTPLRFLPGFPDVLKWYEVAQARCAEYIQYRNREIRSTIILVVVELAALLGAVQSVRIHTDFTYTGVSSVQFFDISPRDVPWKSAQSITVGIDYSSSKSGKKYATPSVVLKYGDRDIDLWTVQNYKSERVENIMSIINLVRMNNHGMALISRLRGLENDMDGTLQLMSDYDRKDFETLRKRLSI